MFKLLTFWVGLFYDYGVCIAGINLLACPFVFFFLPCGVADSPERWFHALGALAPAPHLGQHPFLLLAIQNLYKTLFPMLFVFE